MAGLVPPVLLPESAEARGSTATEMFLFGWSTPPEIAAKVHHARSDGPIRQPEEIAAAAGCLLADQASFLTGATLPSTATSSSRRLGKCHG
jgi:hypothetical protein